MFAETDIVNLVKSGIPAGEVLNSLADAIVLQNLSVLTRGNTLKHKVCLLGGPNTYLPFLQACWRQRIPEVWEERGYEWPKDVPIEELVFVPDNSQYYAAYGACVYGMGESARTGRYKGLAGLSGLHDQRAQGAPRRDRGSAARRGSGRGATSSASSTRSRSFRP